MWERKASTEPYNSASTTNQLHLKQSRYKLYPILESELDANFVMTKQNEVTHIIARHYPEIEIIIGVPLPRLWATADITGRYGLCHD